MARPVPDEAVCPCGSEWFRLVDDGVDEESLDEILDDPAAAAVDAAEAGALELLSAVEPGATTRSGGQGGLVALTGDGSVRAYAGIVLCAECDRPWAPGQRHLRVVSGWDMTAPPATSK